MMENDSNNDEPSISDDMRYFINEFHQKERRIHQLHEWFTEEDFELFSWITNTLDAPINSIPEWTLPKLLNSIESRISAANDRRTQHYMKDVEYNPEWVQQQYSKKSSVPMETVMWVDVLHDWTDKLYKRSEGVMTHKQIFTLAKQCDSFHLLEQRVLTSEAMSTNSTARFLVERAIGKSKHTHFSSLCVLLEYKEKQLKKILFTGDNVHEFHLVCAKALNCPVGSFDLQCYEEDFLIDLDENSFSDLSHGTIIKVVYHKQMLLSDIKIVGCIGSGNYGDVFKGYWMNSLVALKKLNDSTNEEELYQEAEMLRDMRHINIVRFFGLYREISGLYMVMELCETSLDSFLSNNRNKLQLDDLFEMILTLSSALKYLTEWQFMHRDLAARNVLVSTVNGKPVVKLADFGRAKQSHYFIPTVNITPVAWSSPEVLQDLGYSEFSDVYSFGVLMWEILSFGDEPYGDCDLSATKNRILNGTVLSKPTICPANFYTDVLLKCWNIDTTKRPSFDVLYTLLNSVIAKSKEDFIPKKPKIQKAKYGSVM